MGKGLQKLKSILGLSLSIAKADLALDVQRKAKELFN